MATISARKRDRRTQRTERRLHEALSTLIREKPYDSIAVKEILDRADVGRSTFYTHFRDKDDLLDSGVSELLRVVRARRRPVATVERVLGMSLPILQHIDEHRRSAGPAVTADARRIMHDRLREALAGMLAEDLAECPTRRSDLPVDLIARHIAATFVLVLDTWIEREPDL